MHDDPFDLLIRTARIVSPAEGVCGPGWVAVRGDRIAKVAVGDAGIPIPIARQTLEFADGLLLPGLVDMHAHPAFEGSRFGIDPDLHMLPRGTTTALSQGDAGAQNWSKYREHTIEGARTRVRLAINLAAQGESWPDRGSLSDLNVANVDACVAAIESGDDLIWGIAVNVGPGGSGDSNPRELLRRALLAAERTGRPLLYGPRRRPDWSWDEQLELLRPGDVVTYCFSGSGETILDDGRVRSSVRGAQARGVRFDVGHGAASFDFGVAEAAIRDGFLPDSISTDIYRRHVGVSPPHDLPLTASKLIAAGMVEADVWPRVTSRPATYLGLADEIGHLAPGASADLVVLERRPSSAPLEDTAGNSRPGRSWVPVVTVRAGQLTPMSPKSAQPPGAGHRRDRRGRDD